ncbi:hypothetical protein G3A50_20020 [Ancylobacter pratisalsi]|uniref:ATP synthase subunit I n=1 Tax=Ancylobacter pratisalsi TaxID=1745854 RepID=A0A6P1YS83_9HYPH|nr:hypothetical protein G3A50_20020 [Ancylobacter pratisalsi]
MTAQNVLHIAVGLAVGAVVGFIHFATLKRNTDLYLGGGFALAFGLQLLRFAILGAVFYALARLGAGALLAGAIGLLVTRRVFLRRVGGL